MDMEVVMDLIKYFKTKTQNYNINSNVNFAKTAGKVFCGCYFQWTFDLFLQVMHRCSNFHEAHATLKTSVEFEYSKNKNGPFSYFKPQE